MGSSEISRYYEEKREEEKRDVRGDHRSFKSQRNLRTEKGPDSKRIKLKLLKSKIYGNIETFTSFQQRVGLNREG